MSKFTAKNVINNAKWIIICKIIQSVLQLLVGMLCARYLGPSNYGLINYAASIIAFAVPIMRLGFNATLVNELTKDPEHEGQIMGTALLLNVISGVACMFGVYCFVSVMNPGNTETIIVCILYSLSLVFGALEMIQYWFQYKLISKYPSLIMVFSYIIVSLYRIFLLVSEKSIYWFAITHSIEYGLIAITLITIFMSKGQKFSFSFQRARQMFSVGKYYIIASMMVVIFQNTDHIMLTMMHSTTENAYYSAAITCVSMSQFVFLAIIDSFRPMILQQKTENETAYENGISGLYSIILYLALAQSVFFTVFAHPIIYILYGNAYCESGYVLQILNWYYIFSIMGTVRNVWIVAEEKQKYLWRINLSGALANVVLNAFLIPIAGAIGASIATFFTQMITNFVIGFFLKPIRRNNILMMRGLNPKFFLQESKYFIKTILNK